MVGVRSRAPRDVRKWLALDFKTFGVRLAAVGSQPWEMSCHNKQVRSISTLLEPHLAFEGHLAFDADLALESHFGVRFLVGVRIAFGVRFLVGVKVVFGVKSCWLIGLCLGLRCCLLYTSPSPRDQRGSRMPSSA